jgi:hypothetical protein
MSIQIYTPADYPGSSAHTPGFRTWDALESYLSSAPLGQLGILRGTGTTHILTACSDGAGGVEVQGVVDFSSADGSEFTIGAGLNIESITGGPPVQPTLSASGLDVSLIEGECQLNFLQVAGSTHECQALATCSVPTEADGQVLAVGTGDVFAGVGYLVATPGWHRLTWQGAPPVLIATPGVNNKVVKPTTQLVWRFAGQSVESTVRFAHLGGAFATTDPASAVWQSAIGSLFGLDRALTYPAKIYCEGKAAVGFSALITRLRFTGGLT